MAIDVIKEINTRDPQETLQSLGYELKKWKQTKPEHYTLSCISPQHDDSTPSAWINKHEGKFRYHCSVCGDNMNGDMFSIAYSKIHGVDVKGQEQHYTKETIERVGAHFKIIAIDGYTPASSYNLTQERTPSATRRMTVEELWQMIDNGRYHGVVKGRAAISPYNHSHPSSCYLLNEARAIIEENKDFSTVIHQVGLSENGLILIDVDTPYKNDTIFQSFQKHLTQAVGSPVAIFHSQSGRGGHIIISVEGGVFGSKNRKAFPLEKEQMIDGYKKKREIEIFQSGSFHHNLTRRVKDGHNGVIPSMSAGSFEQLIKNVLREVAGERVYEEYFETEKEDTNNDESANKANSQVDDILQRTEKRQHKTLESLQNRFKTKGIDTGFKYATGYAKSAATKQKFNNKENTRTLTINEGLTIFASYTGGGKSTMLATVAHNISQKQKGKILYISLEEVERNLLPRLLLYSGDVAKIVENNDFFIPLNGNCLNVLKRIIQEDNLPENERKVFDNALAEIHSRFLFFYEQEITADILYNLIEKVREKETKISAIVLDYIQILGGGAAGTEQLRIKNVMEAIRSICKDTAIPFIAGAQTSNGRKGGGNEKTSKPIAMGDSNKIREADDIGQSASLIAALNTADDNFVLLKNREGELGRAGIVLEGELGRFTQSEADLSREITTEGKSLGDKKSTPKNKEDALKQVEEHESSSSK